MRLPVSDAVFSITANVSGLCVVDVCGNFRCRGTTKEMREQNPLNARHPACEHRRVLVPVVFVNPFFNRL